MTSSEVPAVGAVLAVKHLTAAKTRLAATLDGDAQHHELVLAMLLDTLAAVHAAGVDPIVIISPDVEVLRATAQVGALGIGERTDLPATINHAYTQGSEWIRRHRPDRPMVMMIQADLPAAQPHSIREVIAEAALHRQSIVADADGTGTAVLIRPSALRVPPRFGSGSAAAHREQGAVELDPTGRRWADLRTDVDTAADLADALVLGVGEHTRAARQSRGAEPASCHEGPAAPHQRCDGAAHTS